MNDNAVKGCEKIVNSIKFFARELNINIHIFLLNLFCFLLNYGTTTPERKTSQLQSILGSFCMRELVCFSVFCIMFLLAIYLFMFFRIMFFCSQFILCAVIL
jgi:hypothetical protein